MKRKPAIYFHADDYGMTPNACQRIVSCYEEGCLNSLSIIPNGCLTYAVSLISARENLRWGIHINLVEGKAMAPHAKERMLVNANGYFKHSFVGLLFLSLFGKRKELKKELYLEIKTQLLTAAAWFPEGKEIWLDSHQHVHMIPLIFDIFLEVIRDTGIPVRGIRIPAEPLTPFLRVPKLYLTYISMNLVKNLLLNFLWIFSKEKFQKTGLEGPMMCGVMFSGRMDERRLRAVAPYFYRKAVKDGRDLEFVFHPGYMQRGELPMDPQKHALSHFHFSAGRKMEYQALHRWKNQGGKSDGKKVE